MPKAEMTDETESHEDSADQSGGDDGTLEQRLDRLEAAVNRLLAGSDQTDDTDAAAADDPIPAPARRRLIDQEDDAEDKVRKALAKIRAEEDQSSRLEAIEKRLETAPQKVRRVTRAMWGNP